MWLIDLEAPPARLRGLLSRWGVEVRAGLYVGNTSARVREDIWTLVCEGLEDGNAVLVYDARNSQGFIVRTAGANRREIVDVDGLWLAQFRPLEDEVLDEGLAEEDVDPEYLEDP